MAPKSNRDFFERVFLHEMIPLETPLVIFIEPSRSCNFRCSYCYHSFSDEQKKKNNFADKGVMDYNLYTNIIDDISQLPKKIKCLHLTSRGEPLINKKLPDMVRYAKEKDIASRINIVTNGALLTPKLNKDLIESGVDSIKISIQGIRQEDYRNIAGVDINISSFIKNIKNLYEIKKNCQIFIKISDLALKNEDDKKIYFEMFSEICDGISIEHIFDIDNEVNLNLNKQNDKSVYSDKRNNVQVCPLPFYVLNISFNGEVIPCCYYNMQTFGNLKNTSISEIWNSRSLKQFRISLLREKRKNGLCQECNIPDYTIDEKDILDDYSEKLIKYFE